MEVRRALRKDHTHCPMIKLQGTRTRFFIPASSPWGSSSQPCPYAALTSSLPHLDTADKPPSRPHPGHLGAPGCGAAGRDSVPVQSGRAPRYRDSQVWSRVLPQSGRVGGWVGWDRIRTKHSDLLMGLELKPRNQTQVR